MLLFALGLFLFTASSPAADQAAKVDPDAVFREPFTLKLPVDKEHYYEQKFDKVPYVFKGDVYLFKDDEFGLNLEIQDKTIQKVRYQKDLKKADVTFKFTQELDKDGNVQTMLHTHNNTTYTLLIDAFMTAPQSKGVMKTSMVPVRAGLSSFEGWPHPIIQLALRNLRIQP